MTTAMTLIGVPLLLLSATLMAAPVPADAVPATGLNTATQRCESAVSAAIQKSRGANAKQVQFVAPKRAAPPAAPDSLQGQGRYQGAGGTMPFAYNCALNTQSGEVAGVIFKDTGAPVRQAEKPWQADLSNLSPEACEAAAAAAARAQYPRGVHVALSPKSRQLSVAPNAQTYLHGQGSMERAAGMPPSAFTFRCELETASGKLLGVQLDWVE